MSANPLAKLDQAKAYLAECRSLPEIKKIRDIAAAAKVYARAQRLGTETGNYAWEIQIQAERRACEFVEDTERTRGARTDLTLGHDAAKLSEYERVLRLLGTDRKEVSRWRVVAEIPATMLPRYVNQCNAENAEATTKAFIAFANAKDGQAQVSSDSNEYYTLPEHIEAARSVLGTIDLDPASHPAANEVVKATRFFTQSEDGLFQEWQGRVWLNPPWGDAGPAFVGKLVESYKQRYVVAAILLINAHATDTSWFQPLWDHLLCFTCPRIHYWQPDGGGKSPTSGSVFVYFGPERKRFSEVFATFGAIVSRVKHMG